MEMAVIGRDEFCLGFMLVGVRNLFEASNADQAKEAITKVLSNEDLGVVIFDEELRKELDEFETRKIEDSVKPVFVTLSTTAGEEDLKRLIKKSIGVELA